MRLRAGFFSPPSLPAPPAKALTGSSGAPLPGSGRRSGLAVIVIGAASLLEAGGGGGAAVAQGAGAATEDGAGRVEALRAREAGGGAALRVHPAVAVLAPAAAGAPRRQQEAAPQRPHGASARL